MVALLAQALVGMLSDRCTHRWGRRRPFIFWGTLADLVVITAIGFSAGLRGSTGYWVLFALAILLQASSNSAHGALQGFIPDLVPEEQRGRYSAVKAILELPVPMILVSFTIGRMIEGGDMWAGLLVAMGVVTLVMLVTMMVRETPLKRAPGPLHWPPFLRLLGMTGAFTALILILGEVTKAASRVAATMTSTTAMLLLMGAAGLITMGTAVAVGVWASVGIAIGRSGARHNPSYTWWVVNRLAYLVGTTNLAGFAVYFLQARLGLVEEEAAGPASRLIMLVGILILALALPSGWLSDRFGRKRLVAISGLVAAFGTLVAIVSTNLTVIYIGGCVIGGATGLFFSANWALGTDLVPPEQAGRYLGMSNLAGAGAGAIGAYIGGPIADFFTRQVPDRPGLGYLLIFAIYGVLFLLSTVALLGVRDKGRTATSG
jgi:MFS family permease